jgi:hypothetical protein
VSKKLYIDLIGSRPLVRRKKTGARAIFNLYNAKGIGDSMIKVLSSKVFPSKATLTKFEYVKDDNRIVFYVRENVRVFNPGGPIQVLEVCAPADKLTEVISIVELEDHLKRNAYVAPDFTEAWAEGHLFVPTINGMPKESKESP